ncbi:terminase TerL endonuclease subunit [Amycolatopsis sp. NPDC049159]|uniref:terminase TerL endonuclease subunit n=1 Tax=Amycolatopsis sp. NPDC049159 TaxID=3157210 RepID=UPI0033E60C89
MQTTTSSPASYDLEARWRPDDDAGPVCGYTFRGNACPKSGAHYCEPRADRVVTFFARMLVHVKGPLVRTPFLLLDWQEFEIIRPLFGEVQWSSEWGTYARRYRIAYIVVARKNGKSEIAAAIQLYMLVGDDEESAEVYCLAPETRALRADLTWGPIGDLQPGDELVGFDENVPDGQHRRSLQPATVTSVDRVMQPCYRVTLTDGRTVVASANHRWLAKNCAGSNTVRWLTTDSMAPGSLIRDLGPAWENDETYGGGYLSGVFDGEASFHRGERSGYRISFAQLPGKVMDRTRQLMEERGYPISKNRHQGSGVANFSLTGLSECFRFLGSVRPVRLLANARSWWAGKAMRTGWAEVASVEFLGEREVVALGTSTKTLFAEGLASHNCAAKDTKQAGKVFEPALRMTQLSPALSKRLVHNKNARRLIDEKSGSHYEILTADAEGELGHNPHAFNLDEVLSQPDGSMWEAMTTAAGARLQELLYATTTETDDDSSFGADLIDEAEKTQEDPARAPHVFAFVRKLPHSQDELDRLRERFPGHPHLPVSLDPFDEANWKWPNPALDQFKSRDAMRRQALDARNDPAKENGFRQFQTNQRVQQKFRWMPMHLYRASGGDANDIWLRPDYHRDRLRGRPAWAGFDLAARSDLTAWCTLIPEDRWIHALWRFWLPEAALRELDKKNDDKFSKWVKQGWIVATPGPVVDYEQIYTDVARDAEDFDLLAADCDVWSSAPVIQRIENDTGLWEIEAYKNDFSSMTLGMNELMALVKTGRFLHHGNPVAEFCFDSVEVRKAPYNPDLIRPDKPERGKVGKRIDGVPAAAMACNAMLREPYEDTGPAERPKIVISSRGRSA